MPGESRWPVLEPLAESARPATANGRIWDTGREFPAARFDTDDSVIPGTFVVLRSGSEADAVKRLDEIEGEGVLYRRVTIDTSEGPAMSYEWIGSTDGMRLLPRGWRPFG